MKKSILILALVATGILGQAQHDEPTTLKDRFGDISVGGGYGVTYFVGDMGRGSKEVSDQGTFFITADKRLNPSISAMGNLMYGRIGSDDFSLEAPHNNFESNFFQLDVRVAYHLDNGKIFSDNSRVSSFLGAGMGMMFFNPKSDMTDAIGRPYHYWNDGRIHDRPEDDPDAENSVVLTRDHTYETELTDSINFGKSAVVIPLFVGFKMRLVNNFEAQLAFTYNLSMSDYLDGWKYGNNKDSYFMGSISLSYHIGKWMPGPKVDYSEVDFKAIKTDDADGDGVEDFDDKCPGTPEGVDIGMDGCPTDTDKDGIADYLDTEPNTVPGSHVNEWGETMTDEEIEALFDPYKDVEMEEVRSSKEHKGEE